MLLRTSLPLLLHKRKDIARLASARPFYSFQTLYSPITEYPLLKASSWAPPALAGGHRGRYLWTDAFAVLNLVTLGTTSSNPAYLTFAARLIDMVHSVLGRTRDSRARLPGASDAHPLAGGLRIGKEADEDDPSGDGDGQYHLYLTFWMFALNRMARGATTSSRSSSRAIHPRFVYDRARARLWMYWKMSVDLARPAVRREGNLDPIDGYVVYSLLDRDVQERGVLAREIGEYRQMLEDRWPRYGRPAQPRHDPLGRALVRRRAGMGDAPDAARYHLPSCVPALLRPGYADTIPNAADSEWAGALVDGGYFDEPTTYRLAFREDGACSATLRSTARGCLPTT